MALEPSGAPGAGEWNVGMWLSYGRSLVTIETADGDEIATPLEQQLSLDYVGSVGLGSGLAVGLALPTVLYQTGDDMTELLGAEPLPRTALGDVALTAKATLLPLQDMGGFGLAALGRLTAPTGDRRSYVGEGATTGELRLLAEANLFAISVRASAGAKLRSAERTYINEEFSHALPWGVGLTFLPRVLGIDNSGRWLWLLEANGAVALAPEFGSGPQSPGLGSVAVRYAVDDVTVTTGVQLPLNDAVGVPLIRAVVALGWAPRFYDEDGDSIADDLDECPDLAEDRDGFEDGDGCPDPDNDYDGVGDDADRCPGELEDADGFEDTDGCPDPDNDRDGIPDGEDACPVEPGPEESHRRGCPPIDTDGDGVFDHVDRCPKQAEDRDEFQDEDGCPDRDNDGDRIVDRADACPNEAGPVRSEPELNGCPSPDRDGDSYDDQEDECPEQPEDFDGVDDTDGCPDDAGDQPAPQRPKPLVTLEEKDDDRVVKWRTAPKFVTSDESTRVDEASLPTARALAQILNAHPRWVLLVGVRPEQRDATSQQAALTRAFTLVQLLRSLTHRDQVAEPVGWATVKSQPGAARWGIGIKVIETPEKKPRSKRRRRGRPRPSSPPPRGGVPSPNAAPGPPPAPASGGAPSAPERPAPK